MIERNAKGIGYHSNKITTTPTYTNDFFFSFLRQSTYTSDSLLSLRWPTYLIIDYYVKCFSKLVEPVMRQPQRGESCNRDPILRNHLAENTKPVDKKMRCIRDSSQSVLLEYDVMYTPREETFLLVFIVEYLLSKILTKGSTQ